MSMVLMKYSVPDSVLDQLADLLRFWGITERDWLLETENAAQRFGYRFIDTHNPKEIDVGIRRIALPWKARQGEWTCMPPAGSQWLNAYKRFVKRIGYSPHFVAYPFGPLQVSEIASAPWYTLPSGCRIHARSPVSFIQERQSLLLHTKTALSFQSRIPRWKREVGQFLSIAKRKKDVALARACEDFLAVCQRVEQAESINLPPHVTFFKGTGIGKGPLRGKVWIVNKRGNFLRFEKGRILVSEDTNPVFILLMYKAKALITDRGGLTSYAATLAREFGIPAVIGTKVATRILKTGDRVEVDTKRGIVRKL